jgi:hypothetical protein
MQSENLNGKLKFKFGYFIYYLLIVNLKIIFMLIIKIKNY